MVSKSKNYFSPMLICWNDIKIHLGFEDSYLVPPPILRPRGGGHSGLNQRVRPSYYNFQVFPRTLCTISTDCFAETPVTVSFNHILCTFWSINMRRFTHQMTNH